MVIRSHYPLLPSWQMKMSGKATNTIDTLIKCFLYRRLINEDQIWRRAPVTVVLLIIQIVAFIIMTLLGGSTNFSVLIECGARVTSLIHEGQWWRLITPVFLHIGIAHLIINSITLYFLGMYIEELFSHWRMLVIYLVSAFTGNLASAYFLPNTISAGASTALFGLFGAFLMLGNHFTITN